MVSIIKNQLLKHLSRFTKNLSADKINLSTLKGEGELSNLELDEIVLTDLLELPSWLRINSAWCNRVSFRIQWTKLKSVPIFLSLDEVFIEVETCEELRATGAQYGLAPAKYSFINKVIDGITVAVNTVQITFKSPAFVASVQISRIIVESKTPSWQKGDLRMTRLKGPEGTELLIFKELEWQTARIEASSTKDEGLTPLRLLTNTARCRITIKKRTSDCFVLGSRLVLILDDLLWVLTDSQLKAALHFLDSLGGLIQKATELARVEKAARKLQVAPETKTDEPQQSVMSRIFGRYDVVETSYHFLSRRIDLHLCDDPGAGRSTHPELQAGAALQVSVQHLQVDFYPYHRASSDRTHWPKYREASSPHSQWLSSSLAGFKNRLLALCDHSARVAATAQLAKLMSCSIVIRIQDFTLFQVSTTKHQPSPFLSAQSKRRTKGDRERFSLPEEINMVHAEFTYFYYPGDMPFPLPPPKLHAQINPVQLNVHTCSVLWLYAFMMNMHKSLPNDRSPASYVDVHIEAIMPRVIFPSGVEYENQRDRPKALQIQVSRAVVTNVRCANEARSSLAELARCVDACQMAALLNEGADFPGKPADLLLATEKLLRHVAGTDCVREIPTSLPAHVPHAFLWTEARDVWSVSLEPVWAEFVGAPACPRPVPLLDAFPLTLWLTAGDEGGGCLAHVAHLVSCQINHYQYLFLLRLLERVAEIDQHLGSSDVPFVAGAVVSQIEITLVMPSNIPGKEEHSAIESSASTSLPHSPSLTRVDPPLQFPSPCPVDTFPELDNISLRSDASISSDGFVMAQLAGANPDAAFQIDEAVEVVEEDTASASPVTEEDGLVRRTDLVSIATIKLHQVEMMQQSVGTSSALKLQAAQISTEECGAIPWDEFQNKFGCRSRAWVEAPANATPCFRLRFERMDGEESAEVRLSDISLEVNTGTLIGLTDLIEDEIIPKPIPLDVKIENLQLGLNEDRPPVNITSPGPIPVAFAIQRMDIQRTLDGVFHIKPTNNIVGNGEQLRNENSELLRRLALLERVSEENHRLRQATEETQILRACLVSAQDDVATLLDEKHLLLERVRALQDQLENWQRSGGKR